MDNSKPRGLCTCTAAADSERRGANRGIESSTEGDPRHAANDTESSGLIAVPDGGIARVSVLVGTTKVSVARLARVDLAGRRDSNASAASSAAVA